MKWIGTFFGTLVGIGVIVIAARLLGLEELIRRSIEAGGALNWATGALALLWLLILLKAPWDLYFQAHAVAFEQQRAKERGIAVGPGRENYILAVRRRLLWLALGAHVASALIIAAITYFSRGTIGYYFAAFYLVSTVFRPAIAGYGYLYQRLRAIGEESRYPREDVEELRVRMTLQEAATKELTEEIKHLREDAEATVTIHRAEMDDLAQRQQLLTRQFETTANRLSREFESTINRLTDNQDVIRGVRAFVRLIAQSATE